MEGYKQKKMEIVRSGSSLKRAYSYLMEGS